MKSLQAVLLNWFAIIAAVTMISVYWNSTLLELFSANVGYLMFLGLGCLWTALILFHHLGTVARLGKNLEESITKMMHTEDEIITTMGKLDVANANWADCMDELHEANKEVRVAGRKLDWRKQQAESQEEQLRELIVKYGGRVTADLLRRREAIDNLIDEQDRTLEAVQENVGDMHQEQMDYGENVAHFMEDLGYLNETIGSINKPLKDLESLKTNLHRMGADPTEFKAFLSGHIQYLSILERITILREMTYSQTIFFDALRQNDGQINEQLFNELILRLPKSLRDTYERTGVRYKDYRCVLSKGMLGLTKYGGMDEASVIKFMRELEARAFHLDTRHSSNMPDPHRFGYDMEEDDDEHNEMQQHPFASLEEDFEKEGKLVITS